LKHSPRKAMDLAVVGVAALLRIEKGICQEILLALGAVAPTPMRALEAEKVLQGKKVNADLIAEAARQAALACRPIDDHRSSAAYRREMVEALTRRAIGLALRE
jgi:carbon-monoxide dehydrogenase medium subunit